MHTSSQSLLINRSHIFLQVSLQNWAAMLIRNRNFSRRLRDEGRTRHDDRSFMHGGKVTGVRRMIKRRGMIEWVIDSNGGQRVAGISPSVACGQIRLAYPSSSEMASSTETFPFSSRRAPMELFEDYTCGSWGYQPTQKTRPGFSVGSILILLYVS